MTPDPGGLGVVDPTNPQSWNRYAYVMNNPINLIDLVGLECYAIDSQGNMYCDVNGNGGGGDDGGNYVIVVTVVANNGPTGVDSIVVTVGRSGSTQVGNSSSGGGGTGSQQPLSCSAAQQAAANLAELFDKASDQSGWMAFGTGILTVVGGVGEGPTAGFDTPGTITAASVTAFFAGTSTVTGAFAAGLKSFANGNMTALKKFDFSQLISLATTAGASKIPLIKPWADRIGDLAGKGADFIARGGEACH